MTKDIRQELEREIADNVFNKLARTSRLGCILSRKLKIKNKQTILDVPDDFDFPNGSDIARGIVGIERYKPYPSDELNLPFLPKAGLRNTSAWIATKLLENVEGEFSALCLYGVNSGYPAITDRLLVDGSTYDAHFIRSDSVERLFEFIDDGETVDQVVALCAGDEIVGAGVRIFDNQASIVIRA